VEPEPVTKADFDEIVDRLAAFWGERDLSAIWGHGTVLTISMP
jgi:hypothetical protein